MTSGFIKTVELNSSERFQPDETTRAVILIVESFSPEKSFVRWLENVEIPVILALEGAAGEQLVFASHLCIAARNAKVGKYSAEEALRLGLINRVVETGEAGNEALALAEKISGLAPLAIRACLKAVGEGLEMPLAEGLNLETRLFTQIFSTADMREGTRAFLEKRKPLFRNT